MKDIFSILIFLLSPFLLSAQVFKAKPLYKVKWEKKEFTFKVETLGGKLVLDKNLFLKSTKYLPEISSLTLVEADLVLESKLKANKQKSRADSVTILGISWDEGTFFRRPLGEVSKLLKPKNPNSDIQFWEDAVENFLSLGETYTIELERSYWTDFRIDTVPPKIKNGWYLAIGGVGLGSVIVGQIFKSQKDDALDSYRNNWRAGLSEEASQAFLNTAKDKHDLAKIFTWGGGILLAGNIGYYLIRLKKIGNQRALYDAIIADQSTSFRFTPIMNPLSPHPKVGFNIVYTF